MIEHANKARRAALRGLSAVAAGVAVVAVTVAAAPADAAMRGDAGYYQYHEAIRAAVVCEDYELAFGAPMVMGATSKSAHLPLWTPQRQDAAEITMGLLEDRIVERVGPTLSRDRLSIVTAAQVGADARIREKGCGSAEVQQLLALFHGDLMMEPAEG
jgi:hypothetical protein